MLESIIDAVRREIVATSRDPFTVVVLAGLLVGALWYVSKTKHPRQNLWKAYLWFLGLFGGLTVLGFGAIAGAIQIAFPDADPRHGRILGRTLAPFFLLAILVPAFRLAQRRIRRPPPGGEDDETPRGR